MISTKNLSLVIIFFVLSSCIKVTKKEVKYQTENVVIVVMDGARYSETWGDSSHKYIPRMANNLAPNGVIHTSFYNEGVTKTLPGHTAIITGAYQKLNNSGKEIPRNPSLFQTWRKLKNAPQETTQIVSSKDKLEVLGNCKLPLWKDAYQPKLDCGVDGLGTGYRNDSITFVNAIKVLSTEKPKLLLINFREPDFSGHNADWEGYLQGIKDVDQYIYELFNFIKEDANYKGKTTIFVTNDHGRHLDDVSNGFASHGDGCEGCRHINLFSSGPDFKEGVIETKKRNLIDISATIEELLHFPERRSNGEVMEELLINK